LPLPGKSAANAISWQEAGFEEELRTLTGRLRDVPSYPVLRATREQRAGERMKRFIET